MSIPLLSDVAYGARSMASRPWSTSMMVLLLAIGIGATTAMFGILEAALIRDLPYENPDRLVMGRTTYDGRLGPTVSGYDYFDYREQSKAFESLAAITSYPARRTILGVDEPKQVEGFWVTWNLFSTLGVRPVRGRLFTADGLVALFGLSRFVEHLVIGVSARDTFAFAAAVVVMATSGIAASYVPALRASRIDPATALRSE